MFKQSKCDVAHKRTFLSYFLSERITRFSYDGCLKCNNNSITRTLFFDKVYFTMLYTVCYCVILFLCSFPRYFHYWLKPYEAFKRFLHYLAMLKWAVSRYEVPAYTWVYIARHQRTEVVDLASISGVDFSHISYSTSRTKVESKLDSEHYFRLSGYVWPKPKTTNCFYAIISLGGPNNYY